MAGGDFPSRLLLALKALSISRGRLAVELAVDKSVISRWLSGQPFRDEGIGVRDRFIEGYRKAGLPE